MRDGGSYGVRVAGLGSRHGGSGGFKNQLVGTSEKHINTDFD